jgi:riboflavin synthase
VQGHVDGLGTVSSVEGRGRRAVVVEASPEILRYCVEKGSITVDGVSLTVAELSRTRSPSRSCRTRSSATTLRRARAGQR